MGRVVGIRVRTVLPSFVCATQVTLKYLQSPGPHRLDEGVGGRGISPRLGLYLTFLQDQ